MRTELQRRRRPLIWVAPAGEAEEVSASRAPHARRSALHPAAWHGQQRPTRTRARRGRRRSGRSSHGPRTAGLHFRGVFPASRLPLETRRAGGGTGGTQSRSRPRRAGAAMPRRPQSGERGSEHNVISPASETDKPSTAPSAEAPRSPRGPSAEARALSRAAAGPDPGRRRGPGRRAHAPHRRGRGQRHNVSSWCVRKMTPEKVSRGRARDRESGAGPSSRERTRRPPWRREPGPDRSPAAWGARFPPSPQLRRSLSVGPWPCRSLDERREAG